MKNGHRELMGRNRRLQGVSGVLDVLAVPRLWNVSLPGLFSFTFVFFYKLSILEKLGLQSLETSGNYAHVLPLTSSLSMCGTLFLLCMCMCKEVFCYLHSRCN